ncbi:major facilitator superfamily domain-containing protein 8-like [Amphiura filiformis]|uniref:major facilitator superfamily domain-containing protein 8-like n=1 Tax=Amphiura filiformis TaxID=82378 RepID=UPI003B215B63
MISPTVTMEYKSKKRLTIIATGLFFFLGGVEYAIIMPSLYLYIQDLGGSPSYLGIVLSAFSFSGLLVAPIFGTIQDKLRRTKILIVIANLFEIIGNFMYFMGFNLWFLLLSRLVAGVGAGVQSTIFAQISRSTHEEDRASAISLALAAKQVGLLLGPGFNLFLVKIHFWIGPFEVNQFTSPGLFMFILWILAELFFIFFYFDLPTLPELLQQQQQHKLQQESADSLYDEDIANQKDNGYERSLKLPTEFAHDRGTHDSPIPSMNETNENVANIASTEGLKEEQPWSWKDEFLKEEVIVLLWAQFVFFFEKMCMETALTPMAQLLMDFGEIENSIMYCLCGVEVSGIQFREVIFCFILVKILSKRVTDRWLIAAGFLMEMFPLILLLIVYPQAPHHNRSANMGWFVVAFITQIAGLAFCGVAIVSLYSKLVSESSQGLTQGIRRSVGGIATILGPLWAGGAVMMGYIMVGVMLILFVMIAIMVAISWKHLKAPGDDDLTKARNKNKETSSIAHDEKSPLLINAEDADVEPNFNSD